MNIAALGLGTLASSIIPSLITNIKEAVTETMNFEIVEGKSFFDSFKLLKTDELEYKINGWLDSGAEDLIEGIFKEIQ